MVNVVVDKPIKVLSLYLLVSVAMPMPCMKREMAPM